MKQTNRNWNVSTAAAKKISCRFLSISNRLFDISLENKHRSGQNSLLLFISMSFTGVLVAALLLAIFPTVTDGKYVEGVVDTSKDMEFLGRFVFEPGEYGQLWYEFKYPAELCCYQMIMFNDEDNQWPYIRANEDKLTCLQKKAQIPSNYNTQITLSTPYNCKNKTENGRELLVCSGTRHFTAKRPRWWFINIANCNGMSPQEGVHIQYKLNMTNGIRPLDKHFSGDERYTLETSIAFTALYFLMALTGTYYKYQLSKKRLLHSTYQLFFTSICLQLASLILTVGALASFAQDGIEMPALKTTGHVISAIGDVIFILTLMLVGKGYTITRGRISTSGSVKLAIFISLYALTYVFLFTYGQSNFDPRDVMFIYDSPAGMGIIVLRVLGVIWLYYCVFFTVKNFTHKLKFYVLFMLFYCMWFSAEPVMIGVANEFIPKYIRAKIVSGVYWTITFIGHMYFLILTRPDKTNKYFPYHIKTNQVAAMIVGDTDDEESNFTNPFMGAPLTRSLTNIFVNTSTPKVTVDPPYDNAASKPVARTKPVAGARPASGARPGKPMVNNFVSASLHAVSESNSIDDFKDTTPATPPKLASRFGPDFSIFCVEKSKTQPTANVKIENEKQENPASKKVSRPKGKKPSKKVRPQQAISKTSAAARILAENDRKTTDQNDGVKQQSSYDLEFVEIPLDDLTITDM
ncbi:transmembrane protein 145-like [Acanthaster planci]|uniref:Transmembrane protein 145-like n=1 Tax=Acanthaster planci TaxID=133434 RepID=A0A8B8A2A7_ACAPL|nr:transmembrane protein 145-like [Acanthaster planci]